MHFNVGFTGGAGRAAGTLLASTDCPFTADVELLTLPGGTLTFEDGLLLFDCDCASVDVTVVLDTCREPDDRLPLDDPTILLLIHVITTLIYKIYLSSVNFDCREKKFVVAVDLSVDFHRFLDYPAARFL